MDDGYGCGMRDETRWCMYVTCSSAEGHDGDRKDRREKEVQKTGRGGVGGIKNTTNRVSRWSASRDAGINSKASSAAND